MLPIIKWAGGKRRFAALISEIIGNNFNNYFEPFVGGGAIMFHLEAVEVTCSDTNEELINFYNVVKQSPHQLINELRNNYVPNHNRDFYYQIRALDRDQNYENLTNVQRAARFMYLNKTCYNGLWRVNKKGQNNVPYGRYVNPCILDEEAIINASAYLNNYNVNFEVNDYRVIAQRAQAEDLVYFDPPYDVEEGQNSFVEYTRSGFNRTNQVELKNLCDELVQRGVIVGISNSNTEFIRNLYQDGPYDFYELYDEITVRRTIGGTPESRREMTELFILGRLR